MCTRVLSACMCVCQILETQGPMKLELQMVVRCHVSSGNQIQVLWKSKCSCLPPPQTLQNMFNLNSIEVGSLNGFKYYTIHLEFSVSQS